MFASPCKMSNLYSNAFIFIDSRFIRIDGDTGKRTVHSVLAFHCIIVVNIDVQFWATKEKRNI